MFSYRCRIGILVCAIILALFFISLGILIIFALPAMIEKKILESVPLTSSSDTFKLWLDPPADIIMEYYVINITNGYEFVELGKSPVLQEVGPFAYREKRSKVAHEFNEDETRLGFKEIVSYHFAPELSIGDPFDMRILTLNLGPLAIYNAASGNIGLLGLINWHKFWLLIDFEEADEHPIIELTVNEFLWGYNNTFMAKLLDTTIIGAALRAKNITKTLGLFADANNTAKNSFTIKTGVDDVMAYQDVVEWNKKTKLNVWQEDWANEIKGTTGSGFHPLIKTEERLFIFSPDLCRTLYFDWNGEKHTVKGIETYRFTPPPEIWANLTVAFNNSENATNPCYCVKGGDLVYCENGAANQCLGSGVLPSLKCSGKPALFSLPHLTYADPKYQDLLQGLAPHEVNHGTYADVEPITGSVMRISKKLQVNWPIHWTIGVPAFKESQNGMRNFKDKLIVMPLVWVNESAIIQDAAAARFVDKVYSPVKTAGIVKVVLLVFGSLLFIASVVLLVLLLRRGDEAANEKYPDTKFQLVSEEEIPKNVYVEAEGDSNQNIKLQ